MSKTHTTCTFATFEVLSKLCLVESRQNFYTVINVAKPYFEGNWCEHHFRRHDLFMLQYLKENNDRQEKLGKEEAKWREKKKTS